MALRDQLEGLHEEFDTSAALLSVLEQVALADSEVVGLLCEVSSTGAGSEGKKSGAKGKEKKGMLESGSSGERKILFQAISNNTADYQMVSSQISPSYATASTINNTNTNDVKKKSRTAPSVPTPDAEYKAVRGLDRLEVAKLYKIALFPVLGFSQAAVAAGLSPTKTGERICL